MTEKQIHKMLRIDKVLCKNDNKYKKYLIFNIPRIYPKKEKYFVDTMAVVENERSGSIVIFPNFPSTTCGHSLRRSGDSNMDFFVHPDPCLYTWSTRLLWYKWTRYKSWNKDRTLVTVVACCSSEAIFLCVTPSAGKCWWDKLQLPRSK